MLIASRNWDRASAALAGCVRACVCVCVCVCVCAKAKEGRMIGGECEKREKEEEEVKQRNIIELKTSSPKKKNPHCFVLERLF